MPKFLKITFLRGKKKCFQKWKHENEVALIKVTLFENQDAGCRNILIIKKKNWWFCKIELDKALKTRLVDTLH